MDDHEHDHNPLPGPRVRVDVHTPDVEAAARVLDILSRVAIGIAADGMVVGVVLIPSALEVDQDVQIYEDPT
jgi:hypothetical protein